MTTPTRLTFSQAKRIAKAAGACDVDAVVSYLTHCGSETDAENSIAALRRNQPRLFSRARQGRAR
ncbi:MAG: hypothetical protein ABSG68_18105 [Thermoguttaceae bacterium]|jgi:hypothetical protein